MKLWVDDIRQAPDDTWTVAKTVTSAINALSIYDFDVISLDHDISHQVTVGALGRPYPCEENFQPVARYIAAKYVHTGMSVVYEQADPWVPKVILHTSNPIGATCMEAILVEAGIKPTIKPMGLANRLEMEV